MKRKEYSANRTQVLFGGLSIVVFLSTILSCELAEAPRNAGIAGPETGGRPDTSGPDRSRPEPEVHTRSDGTVIKITRDAAGRIISKVIEIPSDPNFTFIEVAKHLNEDVTELVFKKPSYVTWVKHTAFGRNRLDALVVPPSVERIDVSSFERNRLGYLTFAGPAKITRIADSAFRNNALEVLDIPSSVSFIGWDAFRNNRLTA